MENKVKSARKTASQRQNDFVARKREAGYVLFTTYVPKAILEECRELIKVYVKNWDASF